MTSHSQSAHAIVVVHQDLAQQLAQSVGMVEVQHLTARSRVRSGAMGGLDGQRYQGVALRPGGRACIGIARPGS